MHETVTKVPRSKIGWPPSLACCNEYFSMVKHSWAGRRPAVLPPRLLHRRLFRDHVPGRRSAVDSPWVGPPGEKSYVGLSQKLCQEVQACGELGSVAEARKVHARVVTSGLATSTFLQNHLVSTYSSCGSLEDADRVFRGILCSNVFSWNAMIDSCSAHGHLSAARSLFYEMPERDIVSWNTMMSGCFWNGEFEETIKLFICVVHNSNSYPNSITFSCVLKSCGALGCSRLGFQLHGIVIKFGFVGDLLIQVSVLDMYVKCGSMDFAARQFELMEEPTVFCWNSMILGYSKSSDVERAQEAFNQMPERDIVSWNMMISAFSQHDHGVEALSLFTEMCREGFEPESMTYASVLGACASIPAVEWGRHLHARIIKLQSSVDVFTGGALVNFYARSGYLGIAKQIFDNLTEHNVVSWTSIIGGYAQFGFVDEAMVMFNQMREVPLSPDEFTLVTVLKACSSKGYVGVGLQLHSLSIKMGYDVSTVVANALIAMYAKSRSAHDAGSIFLSMSTRNVISWTTMISAYSQMGNHAKALALFRNMPERNVVTWNAVLAACIQNGHREQGLKMYILMLREATIQPDCITFTTLLRACADSGALRLGNQIISQIAKFGSGSDVSVANGMVTLYSKCGRIFEAQEVFKSITEKNLISWNAMITGYGQNGSGDKAIETFENMLLTNTKPDNTTYIAILSACSHSGLISEGKFYFDFMVKHHNILPGTEHFACMVDLLGRAGLLEEAKRMIDEMETEPTTEIWGALLNACKIHANTELAEKVVQHLFELDLKHSGSYVLLTHIYANSDKSDDAAGVRRLMKERGIRKDPGCSWLEVSNRIHVFVVNDMDHPQIEDILVALDNVIEKIQAKGYVNQMGSRSPHSEKLAVTFGLISLPRWLPIHIMKNLRICADCHSFIKFVSLVFQRKLVIRDRNRFHHFRGGFCSCGDYW